MAQRRLTRIALAALALAACRSTERTLIVVDVHSDLAVGSAIDAVELNVMRAAGSRQRLSFPLDNGQYALPLRVGLAPAEGSANEDLAVEAVALRAGTPVVREEAIVTFVPGESRLLRLFLAAACRANPCQAPDETCTESGACTPKRRGQLPGYDDSTPREPPAGEDASLPGDAATRRDGPGAADAPASDGPASDAPASDAPASDGPRATEDGALDGPIVTDGGSACVCPSDNNPCTEEACVQGACTKRNLPDKVTPCPGGICIGGACCTGCLDAQGMCQAGNHPSACGAPGKACQACDDRLECTDDKCVDGACQADKVTGRACSTGVCTAGACACGDAGEPCCKSATACKNGLQCQNGTCGACGAAGQICCNGACAPGLLCGNGTCSTCGGIGQPCCAGSSCSSGVCGNDSTCRACGGKDQPCCTSGNACGANLACTGGTCVCGAVGQPCCGGTGCNGDGNLCNGAETCLAGKCARVNPVTCVALNECYRVGTCDPATGVCPNPKQPDATPCNDRNACTRTDTCTNGTCVGGNPVVCTALDQCHLAGACNTTSGACSNPNKPNTTACNDMNACTVGETCTNGACTGGAAPNCDDNDPCTSDSCGPGGCVHGPVTAGTPCAADTNPCTTDVCDTNKTCTHPAGNAGAACAGGVCHQGGCCVLPFPSCAAFCAARKNCCGDWDFGCGLQCNCGGCPPDIGRCRPPPGGAGACASAQCIPF